MITRLSTIFLTALMAIAMAATSIMAADSHNIDEEVYNDCDKIKAVARQIMSEDHYAQLEAMSDDECETRLGGMTRSELKGYLATGEYLDFWDTPFSVGTVTILEPGEEIEWPAPTSTIEFHEDGTHTHVPLGVVGDHTYSWWLPHRWPGAGIEIEHAVASADLEHVDNYFTDYDDLHLAMWTPLPSGDRYVHYRKPAVNGGLANPEGAGNYRRFIFTVRYEYRICDTAGGSGCDDWTKVRVRESCFPSTYHNARSPNCYIP